MKSQPHLVTHPDDLIDGRRYAIEYFTSEYQLGKAYSTGVFKCLMRIRMQLVVVLEYQPDDFERVVKDHVPWKRITKIEELEQT